jgi:adenine-specific DNA-methyltransferase
MPVLTFKGKSAVEHHHRVVPHHVLEIDPKLSLAKEPGLDGNLIVEGDNLLALKSLLPTHAGRIKCVYIDPPYNTGNEGWIYNDNLTQPQFKEWIGQVVGKEGEDACRHDKWCCMMYPRLQLLRELLRDDGAIFVSIDDNEVHRLRLLMDEIFGEENHVGTIAWQKRYAVAGDDDAIGSMHEYVVVYGSSGEFRRGLLPRTELQNARYSNPDNDPRGEWASDNYVSNKSKEQRPTLWYPIVHPRTHKEVWPDENAVWRYSKTRHESCVREKRLYWGPDQSYEKPRLKRFLREVQPGIVPGSWWSHVDAGHNDEAKKELARILSDSKAFETPKPVRLIKRILTVAGVSDGDIVLDSFAGSGTTGHAVVEMNSEDDARRSFVLVQQAVDSRDGDKTTSGIARTVTRERVRRVMEGYSYFDKDKSKDVPGLGGEFTFARLGEPLFREYRDLGKKLPSYEQMARHVWFTETSRPIDAKQMEPGTGRIGVWQGTSYYLLYSPSEKDARPLDMKFLKSLKDENRRKVVYCEKIWVHRDALREFGDVRPMLVPFQLK